jgi:AsmA protein
MKRLLGFLLALVVVLVAAVLLLPAMLNVNQYHDRIQGELQKQLGRPVQLGQMNLSLLPPAFKVQNAVIAEDPAINSGQPFAQVGELEIQLKPGPLLHREIEVASLRLLRPQLELVRAENGAWNFSSLGTHNVQQSKEQQTSGSSKPLSLDRLQIDDGTVAITDQQKHQPRVEYKDIDVVLSNFAPGQPFAVAVSARLPGSASRQAIKLNGHGGPINDATLTTTPFQGTLQLDQVRLSAVRQYMNSPALNGTDASINGRIELNSRDGELSSQGTIRVDSIVVQNKNLGYPVELVLNAVDDLKTDVLTLSNTQVKVGSSPFTLAGTINSRSTPALANLKLNMQNASIAELVSLAQALGARIATQPSGRLTADLTAHGPLTAPAVAGTIQAAQWKAGSAEGNSLNVNLNLAPQGAEMLRTLSGRVTLNATETKFTGVDLTQKLGEIGKATGAGAVGNGATHISALTGDFDLHNGVASTSDLRAVTDAGTVTATGTASLVDQSLDMKATTVLTKASSQQMSAASTGGLMSTVFADQNGQMTIPVLITGSMSAPRVEPDTQAMAQMKLHSITSGTLGNLTSGKGVLGALTGKPQPGAVAGNQQQQNGNSLQKAIGGLFGGGQKKPQQ